MQRNEDGGILIACDFCGTDWDEVVPMIEGHRGSVVCLACLQQALTALRPMSDDFVCTMCLRQLSHKKPRWQHPDQPDQANAQACICGDCIEQATTAFSNDPDVDFS